MPINNGMDKKLLKDILLYTGQPSRQGKGWVAGHSEIPDEFRNVGYDVLDDHLMIAKDAGYIKADRSSSGWFVQSLTMKAGDILDDEPTAAEVLQEQNELLKQQIELIRQSSERAESIAREANKIATGANNRLSISIAVSILGSLLASGLLSTALHFWLSQQ